MDDDPRDAPGAEPARGVQQRRNRFASRRLVRSRRRRAVRTDHVPEQRVDAELDRRRGRNLEERHADARVQTRGSPVCQDPRRRGGERVVHPRAPLRRQHRAHDVEWVRHDGGGRARDRAAQERERRLLGVAAVFSRDAFELAERRKLHGGVRHPQEQRRDGARPQTARALFLQDRACALRDAPVLARAEGTAAAHGLDLDLHANLDHVKGRHHDAAQHPRERAGHHGVPHRRVRVALPHGLLRLSRAIAALGRPRRVRAAPAKRRRGRQARAEAAEAERAETPRAEARTKKRRRRRRRRRRRPSTRVREFATSTSTSAMVRRRRRFCRRFRFRPLSATAPFCAGSRAARGA
mmetsp:Transcript_6884/g.28218  ORF Transcript_6884/g.28218 Transcript_6884/m.28218 type:complete len:352 (+) Transcript_6884:406-1461(+)